MSHWNYRIVHEIVEDEDIYTVRDAFYDDAGTLDGWADRPANPQGISIEELRQDLTWMLAALDEAVIEDTATPEPTDA